MSASNDPVAPPGMFSIFAANESGTRQFKVDDCVDCAEAIARANAHNRFGRPESSDDMHYVYDDQGVLQTA